MLLWMTFGSHQAHVIQLALRSLPPLKVHILLCIHNSPKPLRENYFYREFLNVASIPQNEVFLSVSFPDSLASLLYMSFKFVMVMFVSAQECFHEQHVLVCL